MGNRFKGFDEKWLTGRNLDRKIKNLKPNPKPKRILPVIVPTKGYTVEIIFQAPFVSTNQAKSLHWRELKKLVDPLKTIFFALYTQANVIPMSKISVDARYNSRLDLDNVVFTIKSAIDVLVKMEKLPDDNKKYWPKMSIEWDPTLKNNTLILKFTQL